MVGMTGPQLCSPLQLRLGGFWCCNIGAVSVGLLGLLAGLSAAQLEFTDQDFI